MPDEEVTAVAKAEAERLGVEQRPDISDEEIIAPDAGELEKKVAEFRAASQDDDRELLLQAFSAQAAIDWPALDALLEVPAPR